MSESGHAVTSGRTVRPGPQGSQWAIPNPSLRRGFTGLPHGFVFRSTPFVLSTVGAEPTLGNWASTVWPLLGDVPRRRAIAVRGLQRGHHDDANDGRAE